MYLIAQALTNKNQYIVVTHEKALRDKKGGKIKIPNVCTELGIKYIDFFEMLEIELGNDGDRFILDHKGVKIAHYNLISACYLYDFSCVKMKICRYLLCISVIR